MKYLLVFAGLFLSLSLNGQQHSLILQDIQIVNNKRTKSYIILRELTIKAGDSIAEEQKAWLIEKNRNQLLNTGLFADVELEFIQQATTGSLTLHIEVQENWYIYPYAWLDFIDNDVNVWWEVYDGALNRTLPYLGLKHVNLSGQQDELTAYVQVGFTDRVRFASTFLRKVRLSYTSPYLNKKQTLRATGDLLFGKDRRLRLNTFNNRDSFITNEQIPLFQRLRLDFGLNYRPKLFEQHEVKLSYVRRSIDNTVAELNPAYFLDGALQQRFLSLSYRFLSDRRDFQLYAKRGYYLEAAITKEGFGLWKERDALILAANYAKYYNFSPKWSIELSVNARTNLGRNTIDYYNLPVVGPKPEVVRGYIGYHLRGSDFVYLKSSIRYQLLANYLQLGGIRLFKRSLVPKRYQSLAVQAFIKLNNDLTYVNNIQTGDSNTLNNQLLYGRGLSLDLIFANTLLLELMVNANDLGETNFRVHTYYAF
ncbi:MAG: BamA/TamA family outer membrane protein [Bacteroidota bacterium]